MNEGIGSYLRERPVVPEVTFVRKAIADIAKLALLDILFDGVQCLFFGNLESCISTSAFGNVVAV